MSVPSAEALAQRWFTDVSTWEPASLEWHAALELLPCHEQEQVARFVFVKDQRLALASRVLQRRLISYVQRTTTSPSISSSQPLAQIEIQRTPENKPYWRRSSSKALARSLPGTWNYNVSHHGTVVAIASHPHRLIGVDIMQITERPRGSAAAFFRAFKNHFTAREWSYIYVNNDSDTSASNVTIDARNDSSDDVDDGAFVRFYQLWSLKEALIKAIGIGLGFELQRAEFCLLDRHDAHGRTPTWQLSLDRKPASKWTFECAQVDASHVVSIALGPLDAMWNPATSSIFVTSPEASSSSLFPNADAAASECHATNTNYAWRRKTLAQLLQLER